jgi:hypothetical protein
LLSDAFFIMAKARISPERIPILCLAYCWILRCLCVRYSDSKKYRQETLLSKVESEPSVT